MPVGTGSVVSSCAVQECVDDECGQRVRVLVRAGPVDGFAEQGVVHLPGPVQVRGRGEQSPAAEESSAAQAQALFDINVFGVIRMTNAILPHMRAQRGGRVINISSIVGFMPQPYMAAYAASKHAVEGYSESVDHEVREYGVRVLLVEPAWTSTAFDAASVRPDQPVEVYARQRHVFEEYMAGAVKDGDDPTVVAKEIVAAATDAKPKLRYTAGVMTGRVRIMRRLVPARMFDQQLRKQNRLPA